jgi:RNA polymerase sigma-70 factor (ECF subfamily)
MKSVSRDENEEQTWVEQLRSGNPAAFEKLYNRYKRQVSSQILKLVRSVPIAEDLVHDLFVRVWNQRERLDATKSFSAYLYRMSENMTMDFFRKVARDKTFRDYFMAHTDSSYSHVEEVLADKEKKELLHEAVAILPPQCRLVFTLCKLEGKSSEEVSRELNVSLHTVSNHLAKARKMMHDFLLLRIQDPATLAVFCFIVNFSD